MKDFLKKLNEFRRREVELFLKMSGRLFLCSMFVGTAEQIAGQTTFFYPVLLLSSLFTFSLAGLLDLGDSPE